MNVEPARRGSRLTKNSDFKTAHYRASRFGGSHRPNPERIGVDLSVLVSLSTRCVVAIADSEAFRERISGLLIERTIDLSCLAGNGARRLETPENIESKRSSSRSFLVFIEA